MPPNAENKEEQVGEGELVTTQDGVRTEKVVAEEPEDTEQEDIGRETTGDLVWS